MSKIVYSLCIYFVFFQFFPFRVCHSQSSVSILLCVSLFSPQTTMSSTNIIIHGKSCLSTWQNYLSFSFTVLDPAMDGELHLNYINKDPGTNYESQTAQLKPYDNIAQLSKTQPYSLSSPTAVTGCIVEAMCVNVFISLAE
ncbi:hypothetical protein AMECASPLE_014547 [Ameca splendens]|uniref:Uncharacterized protein n=1 Tax=Ameca splendens TaxID=208324 RepID=A0ABV0Y1H6_9TELE